MSTHVPPPLPDELPAQVRVAIVAARFNAAIVDELLAGCLRQLRSAGVEDSCITVHRVPGAFELPVAAQALARTRSYAAVICLGCVVRGDTPHFEYVAGQTARGIQQVALDAGLPVIFGVLTTNTHQQALDRIGGSHGHAGENAANAALEMVALLHRIAAAAPTPGAAAGKAEQDQLKTPAPVAQLSIP